MPPLPRRPLVAALALAAGALLPVGCGSADRDGGAAGKLRVEAAFYPLQWMAQEVGGRHVSVANLTRSGVEPHELELTPRDVAAIQDADLVVHLSGFQPAVDTAVAGSGVATFDARPAARLDLQPPTSAAGGEGGDAEQADPHFWLDPTRLASVADAFAERLAEEDPAHAAAYRTNLAALTTELDRLDAELAAVLEDCPARELVTSHTAFGYLAQRYGMEQVGIAGLSPEQEPTPADLAAAADFVEDHDVRTIYFETLVDPAVARTVADEAGARTAVLDPVEGLSGASRGDDYVAVMRANLASLQAGQPCR